MSIEMASADIASMLLADGRLPTGGHAHSSGLEPALAGGLLQGQVPDFIRGRLETVGLVEAAATVITRRWAVSEGSADELEDISRELLARTPSAPLREASIQLGRGLARLASRLWPQHPRCRCSWRCPGIRCGRSRWASSRRSPGWTTYRQPDPVCTTTLKRWRRRH